MLPRLRPARPDTDAVLAGFHRPKFVRLRLERFPRGIDNQRIDVALGPALDKAITAYARTLVRRHAQELWRQPAGRDSETACEVFRRVLVDQHSGVMRQARSAHRLERAQLFQLAVLKQLLATADSELLILRTELEDARSLPARQLDGQSLQLHQQAVQLARHAAHIRYRTANQLVRELMRLEHASLSKLRKSVLGLSWPIPEVMLGNPLLQLDGLGSARDFSRIYPFLLHTVDTASRAGRCVFETFAEWLPAGVAAEAEGRAAERGPAAARRGAGGRTEVEQWVRGLFGRQEFGEGSASWLDQPENATALLGGAEAVWPRPCQWHHPGITLLQRQLNRQLESRLHKAGLMPAVYASYALSEVYPALGLVDAEELIYGFLKGDLGRREMTRRLAGLDGVTDAAALLRRIDELRRAHDRAPANHRRQQVARLAGDFLRLRRDLKLAWRLWLGMDGVRLVTDPREQELSRANNLLQLFCRDDAALGARGSVIGHVIVKVDVRHADEVSAQMRRRSLDPAAHFSRYFYDPVTSLLDRFDAHKVVVEGDSVMLSLLECEGDAADRPAVAWACCLARRILGLLDAMNAEQERIGVCPLELGIGIAYADEPPTYLSDHGRRVTISSAISCARRIAGCDSEMRRCSPMLEAQGVCVASPIDAENGHAQLVRYNVNGIELDDAAFAQLHVELALRRLLLRERGGRQPSLLYAASVVDTRGDSHLLVIRESPVRLWMGGQLLETADEGRRYYEVVSDQKLLARVTERLGGTPAPAAGTPGTA